MSKKIIINESVFHRLICEEYVNKTDIPNIIKNNQEIKKYIETITHDSLKKDKDLEKKVKEIISKAVHTLFKTLWQRSAFYEDEIKK